MTSASTFRFPLLFVSMVILTACMTVNDLASKYPGYTVIAKEQRIQSSDVPVYILSCVRPDGLVKCQVEGKSEADYGVNECAISCNGKRGDRWVSQETHRTTKIYSTNSVVTLRSPSGQIVEQPVPGLLFDDIHEGQVLGH